MTTTTFRAAAARVRSVAAAIDWQEVAAIVGDGIRILWAAIELLAAALVLTAETIYEHRAQIRSGLVAAVAATYLAGVRARRMAERCYHAGCWCRLQLMALSDRAASLTTAQPVPALAPITAGVQASREALGLLVAKLYPALA